MHALTTAVIAHAKRHQNKAEWRKVLELDVDQLSELLTDLDVDSFHDAVVSIEHHMREAS